jgi:predicted subunit of tRNA(5-methylaminomethyl-2-thiouridylate) methyltransferase
MFSEVLPLARSKTEKLWQEADRLLSDNNNRIKLTSSRLPVRTPNDLRHKRKALVKEVKERRLELIESMDVGWFGQELRKQYDRADEAGDTRTALAALTTIADRLKIVERSQANVLQVKAGQWSAADLETIYMDVLRHSLSIGDIRLTTRILEVMSKRREQVIDSVDYEAELRQLLASSSVVNPTSNQLTSLTRRIDE